MKSKLTFIKKTKKANNGRYGDKQSAAKALYRCECGNEKEITIRYVNSGHTISCGCYAARMTSLRSSTHGLSKHPLFYVWTSMKDRCYNKNNTHYHNWGGRGVRVCNEWLNNFKTFYDWCMRNGWRKGLQIDKDLKGDGLLYSPETCSLLTNKQNANARRGVYKLQYNGEIKTQTEWAEIYGLSPKAIIRRIKEFGWPLEKAITTPMRKINKI